MLTLIVLIRLYPDVSDLFQDDRTIWSGMCWCDSNEILACPHLTSVNTCNSNIQRCFCIFPPVMWLICMSDLTDCRFCFNPVHCFVSDSTSAEDVVVPHTVGHSLHCSACKADLHWYCLSHSTPHSFTSSPSAQLITQVVLSCLTSHTST